LLKRADLSTEQNRAIDELVSRKRAQLWAKPGSGKTTVAATAVTDLFCGPTLVVATRRIVELVWQQEFTNWEHLQHLETRLLTGKYSPAKRLKHLYEDADFYLINYELLPWLADELSGDPWPFGSVIFDEVSKMKNPGTRRFKKVRKPILDIDVRFGLTGTPRGNSIMGLWGQSYVTCATPGKTPFAPTMAKFKGRWFYPVDSERRIWVPMSGTEQELQDRAAPFAYSMPRASAAKEARVVPVPVALPASVRRDLAAFEADLELQIGKHHIAAVEPSVNRGKRLQLCSGAIYIDDERNFVELHTAKLDALDDVIDEMQGDALLVFYRYRHELDRIKARHPDLKTIDDVDDWLKNGGTLAVHPASAAHGLNLHVGGCSTSVWFTLPDEQELWEQGNRRLARTGQKNDVHALVLTTQGTIEEKIADSLARHGVLQDELIDSAEQRESEK